MNTRVPLSNYGSRGETPLEWAGSGAGALGFSGPVTAVEHEALFGPGGAKDPTTGERLVSTRDGARRLGHKSVAIPGVIGRADDMHRILDAEREATLAYLDRVTREAGGRRGQAAEPTPTEGLVYSQRALSFR